MNTEKIFQPKRLATISLVLTCVTMIFNVYNVIINGSHAHLDSIANLLNAIRTALPSIFLIIYLAIILFVKRKDMNKVNFLFFVQLVVIGIISLVGNIGINVTNFKNLSTLAYDSEFKSIITTTTYLAVIISILVLISSVCSSITSYGIAKRKKIPYKQIMIVSLCVIAMSIILNLYMLVTYKNMLNFLNSILSCISGCSFTLFMYQYGISISERSKKNER